MLHPRWCLIINGKSAGDEPLRDAVHAMRERGVELSVRVTWERDDAARYVAEAIARGVDTLIAAGGDGTLSNVTATLAEHDAMADELPALGLVPLGTANDFASAAQLPLEPLAALELIHAQPAQPVDLLRIDADGRTHWCANLASGGFGTQVTVDTSEGMKSLLGGLAYVLTGVAKLGRIETIDATLCGPGFQWHGGFIALGVGNGRLAGGGQALCPDAIIDDGQLDLTIVPDLGGDVGATVGTLLLEGKHAALDRVAIRTQLPWLEISAPQPLTLNLDGEPVESLRFAVHCVPRRVRLHLPPGCPLLGVPGNPLPVDVGIQGTGLPPSAMPA